MLRGVLTTGLLLQAFSLAHAAAAPSNVAVELNTMETAEGRCRLTFVIENKGAAAVDVLKLDLVVFDKDNRVNQRLITEMGPVRVAKTVVKVYAINGACEETRSVLVNDVSACAPAERDSCLDGLGLSSRVEGVRLFK